MNGVMVFCILNIQLPHKQKFNWLCNCKDAEIMHFQELVGKIVYTRVQGKTGNRCVLIFLGVTLGNKWNWDA